MGRSKLTFFFFLVLSLSIYCCKTAVDDSIDVNDSKKIQYIEIDTVKAKVAPFYQEYLTNGILIAKKNYQLIAPVNGMLKNLLVIPGQHIKKEDVIALLENKQLEINLEEKKLKLNKALIELEDYLLGYNFSLADSNDIPEKIWRTACSRASFDQSKIEYQVAKDELENLVVKAVFSGVVANIEILPGQQISKGDVICNVLYLNELTCEFSLIEDDYLFIEKGQTVNVIPFALNKIFQGVIYAKNPEVSQDGLFTVFAEIENPDQNLVNGMHVKVKILTEKKDELIIPKDAVVSRNDDNIVFTYVNGKAVWNFVEISSENNLFIAISKGLVEGDIVITEGNLFLNEGSFVKVKNRFPEK